MRVVHRIGNKERVVDGDAKIFLTNKKGNYLALGTPQTSDFDGFFTYDAGRESLFKILHDIRITGTPEQIVNCLTWAERNTGDSTERFFLTSNALLYEIEGYAGDVTLTLDCKELYDDSAEKRIYNSMNEELDGTPVLHVHYSKYLDLTPRYTRHVLIAAVPLDGEPPTIMRTGFWREAAVPFDQRRGMQDRRWVYDACTVRAGSPTRIFLTQSSDYEKAREKMRYVLEHQESIIAGNMKYPEQRFGNDDLERAIAMNALDALVTKRKHKSSRGLFAGLPWFFQYWMRDEAIAVRALLQQKQYALCKEILMRWTHKIAKQDTATKGGSSLASADGPGLVAKRLHELLLELQSQKQIDHFFSREELEEITEAFTCYVAGLPRSHDLILNRADETWMDTSVNGDGRAGLRIEVQLLVLCIHELLGFVAKLQKRKTEDTQTLLTTTKEWFYDRRGWLLDGFYPDGNADIRTRPNTFLAWYYYPGLLSREEWEKAFDHALEKLWLPWGGLASIGRDDPHFCLRHTGVTNESYHHGDAWYFVNNIAAIALFSLNPHKYHDYIEAILAASTRDLLAQGYAGHASEISDAAEQNPMGCFAQAWSAATLVELMQLMRTHKPS